MCLHIKHVYLFINYNAFTHSCVKNYILLTIV